MLHLVTKILTLWILLCCRIRSLKGQNGCAIPCKKNVTVTGSLNSAVLLPCTFMVGDTDQITVAWSQDSDLVIFDKMKYIRFSNNKEGRLKVFPYMSNIGNFSVQLDNLQHFDQGSYCCQILNESNCITVKVNLQKHESGSRPQQENLPESFFVDNWYIIVAASGGFLIVLVIACICCVQHKFSLKSTNRDYINENRDKDQLPQDSESNRRGTNNHPALDTECDQGDGRCNVHETGIVPGSVPAPMIIYENNEHDPEWGCVKRQPCVQEGAICIWRTQEENAQKPYYVNQSEIRMQAEAEMKTKKRRSIWKRKNNQQSLEYENPIYSNKTATHSQEMDMYE
ncbi:uncharacterized protein LOC114911670 isoform X2 [Scleropages formosus]|uniref:uncharacterized protein LOC114911670 isoform X2 n=1 Tax=Scleropages formosus TaxID=113540 RepID=UPI0010FABD59|nr:uncharacterized protein LOC114911670 isoform X2 [Scleropages formosus]